MISEWRKERGACQASVRPLRIEHFKSLAFSAENKGNKISNLSLILLAGLLELRM